MRNKVGIVGYGAYVPKHYVSSKDIDVRAESLGLVKKSLASWDEDSVTMAVEAGIMALNNAKIDSTDIGALYIGSESPAYAVNPSSTIVADVLNMNHHYQAVDLQFACKAATAGLQMVAAQIASNGVRYGLVIGSDKSQAQKRDALEWSAGAAAAALLVGRHKILAQVIATASYSSDTPDFWRRENQPYPSHGGRFTGKPAYFRHVLGATRRVLELSGYKPKDLTKVIFHMPNGKFPVQAAEILGFSREQLENGLTVTQVGNPYAASSLLGLAAALDKSKPDDLILMTSYGSGAGSDSFVFKVTEEINTYPQGAIAQMFRKRTRVSKTDYDNKLRWK